MKQHFSRKEISAFLKQAPEFAEIARASGKMDLTCEDDLLLALVQSIVSQQLALRAADAVFGRVKTLQTTISAETILAADPERLRACGLSRRKTEYLIGIARAAQDGILDFRKMKHLTDEQVIAELVRLRGVGTWTAEMLLIFSLGRRDVLSEKDLGIRNGMKLLYERNELSPEFFEEKRKRYSPYGTQASLYLWRIKDGGLGVHRS